MTQLPGECYLGGQAKYKIHSQARRIFSFPFPFGAHLQANALVGKYSAHYSAEVDRTDASS